MAENRNAGLDIRVLEDRELLLNFEDNPKIDRATGTFLEGWHSAGLEPADSTWALNRDVTSNTTNLTGGQTATSYTAGAVTSTVAIIPGSPVLDMIEWPETVVQGGTLYRKHTARVAKAYVARVHHFDSGIVGIMVSREKADLTVADRSVGTDPTARTINATWNNGDDEVMAEERFYRVNEDGTVEPIAEKIFQEVTDVQDQITAGTAFVPAASAASMTEVSVTKGEDGLVEFEETAGP